jgi:hypothetical protein
MDCFGRAGAPEGVEDTLLHCWNIKPNSKERKVLKMMFKIKG